MHFNQEASLPEGLRTEAQGQRRGDSWLSTVHLDLFAGWTPAKSGFLFKLPGKPTKKGVYQLKEETWETHSICSEEPGDSLVFSFALGETLVFLSAHVCD